MVVIGVFSSCDTFATKLRLELSCKAKDAAMRLNAAVSSDSSSLPLTDTRGLKSPVAYALVALYISRSGRVKFTVNK